MEHRENCRVPLLLGGGKRRGARPVLGVRVGASRTTGLRNCAARRRVIDGHRIADNIDRFERPCLLRAAAAVLLLEVTWWSAVRP